VPSEEQSCPECREKAVRQYGVGLQVHVSDKEFEFDKPEFRSPVASKLEPGGRKAEQYEQESNRIIAGKRKMARAEQRARGTSRERGGMRHLGSIDIRHLNAIKKTTGEANILSSDPVGTLKRAGRYFHDD